MPRHEAVAQRHIGLEHRPSGNRPPRQRRSEATADAGRRVQLINTSRLSGRPGRARHIHLVHSAFAAMVERAPQDGSAYTTFGGDSRGYQSSRADLSRFAGKQI